MQRNRGGRTSPPKSRSASASSATSNSQTSSSGSSSSGSSSSGSSSSGSSSSGSDTEASRASSQSRASRSSQKSSNQATPIKKGPNKTTVNSPATNKKTNASAKKNTQGSTTTVTTVTSSKNRISGTVTNTKTISPLSKGLTAKNTKRKTIATSSESEEAEPEPPPPPVKKVATKPAPKAPVKGRKGKATPTNTPAVKTTGGRTGAAAKGNTKKGNAANNASSSNNENVNTSKSGGVQPRKSQAKSIFSPENSSEDSDSSISKPVVNTVSKPLTTKKQSNVSASKGSTKSNTTTTTTTTTATNKKKGAVANRIANKKQTALPAPTTPLSAKSASSTSSASGTNSSASSTSSSSEDSSSDEAEEASEPPASSSSKKPSKDQDLSDNKNDSAPSTPNSVRKTRPVTRQRRGTVKSKTIPTTTTFNQLNALTQSVSQVSSAYDSAASDFSDEPKSLARVPAKSQHKPRIKPSEEDEEALERERKCPFPCCDSQGHLSGRYPTHSMLTTCPKYHGFTLEECKENAEEREKRETERKKYYVPNQPHHKKPRQLSQDAKNWIAKTKELKQQNTSDGLCSEYDLSLWNDSLALAAGKIEQEQGEALSFRSIAMGRWEMSCWCASPYPEPLCHCRRLFICEFCLKPVQSGTVLRRHCAKCVWRHPPGDEIYRKDRLSVWEVDGKNQKTYCQNLCLLAKCFLDHKTLYLDVDPFLFYVMTLADSTGCHIVGYFSKEKNQSFLNYNVSCILTLPPYMRQGFGRLLIDFSYLLTRVEGKVGSPEKPLSDLGLISYRSYWKDAVLRRMCACASREMNVKDLSIELGVTSADLISTLQFLGMLKYWKGKHLVLKKQDVLEEYLERVRRRGEQRQIDSSCLRWRPATITD